MNKDLSSDVAVRLDAHLRDHPRLVDRIYRQLLFSLHTRAVVTIDQVYDEARRRAGRAPVPVQDSPNQPTGERMADHERAIVEEITRDYVVRHFSIAEVDDMVNLTLKRERAERLGDIATLPSISFRLLREAVQTFCALPTGETMVPPSEMVGIRVDLTRRLISDQLEFLGVAKNHLRVRDFEDITRRIVGTEIGQGRIGGKAGGMVLAHCILASEKGGDPDWPLAVPESYYLRSDTIDEFLDLNGLNEYHNQKYKPIEEVRKEYPLIKGVFRNSPFPVEIVQQLRAIIEEIGTHPLIVRSSSLLEDRFGTAFCGKYESVFLANQGDLESRLRALLGAIAEVFASTLAPDPILYRQEHNLIDYSEDMAVLIQKVVGQQIGPYFLPAFAGVAFSRNEYRWSPRIRKEDGLVRVVMGLGTRAVDRVGSDYPRMVALGAPTLRPESTVEDIRRQSQRTIDVINMERNRLESITLDKLLGCGEPVPMLDRIVSIDREGALYTPTGTLIDAPAARLHVTFDKLLGQTGFARRMQSILHRLEEAYGLPVDIEFAYNGHKLFLLQCRAQSQAPEASRIALPTDIPDERVVFTADRFVRTGQVEGIEYVIYVDPRAYDAVPSRDRRHAIGRVVGRLNRLLEDRCFILVGPGRWGSNDIRLGVPVTYADINHARMLIEVARRTGGYVPEVSFGTHFFQDLIEAGILYLPLYPDEEGVAFNEDFLNRTPNALPRLLPDGAEFADEVRVIDVSAVSDGAKMAVIMDGETDQACAYLTE
jgi:hypothetical protein